MRYTLFNMNCRSRQKPRREKTKRPSNKARPVLLKLRKDLDRFARKQSAKEGKTLVRFVEDCIESMASLSTLPAV